MSPAEVHDQQIGPTPERPFMRYRAGVTCSECPDWLVVWTAETPLGHLANVEELDDMARGHNRAEHHTAATPRHSSDYRPTIN